MMNLTIVPFGNAKKNPFSPTYQCQHGKQECEGNRWEQCAIAHYPNTTQHLQFYVCMETAADSMLKHVKSCAKAAGMDYSVLSTCYNGPESAKLQAAAAAATPSDHQYVPWIVINGKNCLQGCDGFVKKVCRAYKGPNPAPICGKIDTMRPQASKVTPCPAVQA